MGNCCDNDSKIPPQQISLLRRRHSIFDNNDVISELDIDESNDTEQKPFIIEITQPPNDNDNKIEDTQNTPTSPQIPEKNKKKFDSTLGGKISWKKVADFSSLLPRDVKLKLWNGIFKNEMDNKQSELKKISKVLRTFILLKLTRVWLFSLIKYK